FFYLVSGFWSSGCGCRNADWKDFGIHILLDFSQPCIPNALVEAFFVKKLLIVGDSLSMSRHREGVTYEQMYPTLLACHLKNWLVINGSVRANTSRQIISENYQEEYILPLLPDVVVL